MANKFSYISENQIRHLEHKKVLDVNLISLPSKPIDRKHNHVFVTSIALVPSEARTFLAATPSLLIDSEGRQSTISPLFFDVDCKEALKTHLCEIIDNLFESIDNLEKEI